MKKSLHILIDGPDGVGKTTICQLLSKKLKIPVIKMADMPKHFKNNPEAASEVYNKTIIQFKDSSFIMDRGWPTSIVYSLVYGRSYKDLEYLKDIRGKLNEKLVILIANKPFRGDKLIKSDKWKRINDEYAILFDEVVKKGDILINTSSFTPQQICNLILKNI